MKFYPLDKTTNVPYPAFAGVVVANTFTYSLPADVATGDIIELGVLPHGCHLVDAKVITDAVGITADIGFITDDTEKACGAELYPSINLAEAAVTPLSNPAAYRTATDDEERSIGLVVKSGTPTGGLVTLQIEYTA